MKLTPLFLVFLTTSCLGNSDVHPSCAKGSALFPNLTDEKKQNCEECGQPDSCPDVSETGGLGEMSIVLCERHPNQMIPGKIRCVDPAGVPATAGFAAAGWVEVDTSDCPHFVTAPESDVLDGIGSFNGWQNWYGGYTSLCQVDGVDPSHKTFPWATHPYRVCWDFQKETDQVAYAWLKEELPPWTVAWAFLEGLDCPPSQEKSRCAYGIMGLVSPTEIADTCRCDQDPGEGYPLRDNQCPDGYVCEGGYVPSENDPGISLPTFCLRESEQGNGPLPDGPEAYGLSQWEEGIILDGDYVIVSQDMFSRATGRAQALLNDDQRFSQVTGEVTYVGPNSLFSYLGIQAGDVLAPQYIEELAFAEGDPLEVIILSASGQTRSLYVVVDWSW